MNQVKLVPIEEALIDEIDEFWEKQGPNNAYDRAVGVALRTAGWSDEDVTTELGYLPSRAEANNTSMDVLEELERTLNKMALVEARASRAKEAAQPDPEADSGPVVGIAAE